MPATLKYQIAYPAGTVAPNVPVVMQAQAQSVEAALLNMGKPRAAEYTGPAIGATAGGTHGFGAFTASSSTRNNDFVTVPASSQLKITKEGTYTVTAMTFPAAGGKHNLRIKRVSPSAGHVAAATGGDYGDAPLSASTTRFFDADTILSFEFLTSVTGGVGTHVSIVKHSD